MDDLAGIVVIVLVIAVLFSGVACVQQSVLWVNAEAQIEQLRGDLRKVTAQRSEDAVGQATEWNQIIAKRKRWNQVPVICLWIPNGWDRVKEIEIPE